MSTGKATSDDLRSEFDRLDCVSPPMRVHGPIPICFSLLPELGQRWLHHLERIPCLSPQSEQGRIGDRQSLRCDRFGQGWTRDIRR